MVETSIDSSKNIEIASHGKLLISGEYFVLDGAKAFALPSKFGQNFKVHHVDTSFNSEKTLNWLAYTKMNVLWLDLAIDIKTLTLTKGTSKEATMLLNIIKVCKELNPNFLNIEHSVTVEAHLEFPRSWGLGSSSTLIYFIAQWAGINPYELLEKTFGGSGYDIACASSSEPLIYTRNKTNPIVQKIAFKPTFRDQIFFVHLNEKMNSRNAIQYYKSLDIDKSTIVNQINELTDAFIAAKTIEQFENCINKHENLISDTLSIEKVKDTVFNEYWGAVKSLGAWGGDFVMMTNATKDEAYFRDYLRERGFSTVLSYQEMIID